MQTDTHAARITGGSGEPKPGGSRWGCFQSFRFSYWPLSPPTGWNSAAHACVSPRVIEGCGPSFTTRRPAVFTLIPQHVRGQSAFVPETPCHTETGLQQVVVEAGASPDWHPTQVSGVCSVRQDTRRTDNLLCQPAGTFWNALGTPHSRGHGDSCSVL